MSNCATVMIMN